MSNEKTSRTTTNVTVTSTNESSMATRNFKDEDAFCENTEQPIKPPRQKQKCIRPVETAINDLDEESEVSLSRVETNNI